MNLDDPEPLPDGWTEGTVRANGVDVHYVRTGAGSTESGDGPARGSDGSAGDASPDQSTEADRPPLVVSHGVFDDGPCRTPLARELEDDYDLVLLDTRGHGRSDAPDSGYGVGERVADLVGAVEALGLSDPILFGHSLGGDTVAATAARHPDLPRAVVIVDPAGMLADDGDGGVAAGADEWIESWQDHTKEELLTVDDELRGHVEAGDEGLARRLADARRRVDPAITAVFEDGPIDPAELFPAIEAPTLVLKADADEAVRERDRERAGHLPDGRLVHVDGAGHCVFRDRRGVATEQLRAFLAEV